MEGHADVPAFLQAWENDANWMKQQPCLISTQLHQGIAGSAVFMNYAVWESVAHGRLSTVLRSRKRWNTIHRPLLRRRIFSRGSPLQICVLARSLFSKRPNNVLQRHL